MTLHSGTLWDRSDQGPGPDLSLTTDQVFTVSTLSTVTPTLCTGNIHQNKGILLHNKHKQIIEGTQIEKFIAWIPDHVRLSYFLAHFGK